MRYFTVYVLNTVIMFNVFVTLSGVLGILASRIVSYDLRTVSAL